MRELTRVHATEPVESRLALTEKLAQIPVGLERDLGEFLA
jgi:hypothetical protein